MKYKRIFTNALVVMVLFVMLGIPLHAKAGAVFISGHDPVWHSNFGGNASGARNLATVAIEFGRGGSTLPFLFVESISVPVPSGNAHEAPFLISRLGYTATDFVVADAAMLNGFSDFRAELDNYSAVVVASDHGGMLSAAELQFLNDHADDLIDYVNSGGGVVAFAESNARGMIGATQRFGFLPFVVSSTDFGDPESGNTVTSFGVELGLVNSDINGNFSHNFFTATGGMEPVDLLNGNTARPLSLAFSGLIGRCGASVLAPQVAFNQLGTVHQVTAKITDSQGQPVPDSEVAFEVTEGPNAGDSGVVITDVNGVATFDYTGDGGIGVDRIIAICPEGAESNPVLKFWDEDCQANGISDTCDLDCAGFDGLCSQVDGCGLSNDTNNDQIPDECNQPPVAACQDVELTTDLGVCTASPNPNALSAQVGAGSYDLDDNPITLSLSPIGPYHLGDNAVTLTVTDDKGASDSCHATVAVVDKEGPVLGCPTSVAMECTGSDGTAIPFNATATDNCSVSPLISCDPTSGSIFPVGATLSSCSATDESGNANSCDFTVTVQDTTKPVISSVSVTPRILWPPNHKMVPVFVSAAALDACDTIPICKVTSVISNEPINSRGDGDTAIDWEITGDLSLNLRAERSGGGNSREYTITVACTDNTGNTSTETVIVTVPHDQRMRKATQKKAKG